MHNATLGKSMGNVRKHWDIKLVATVKRKIYLISEGNCHATKFFIEYLLPIEMKKSQILINKLFYWRLSILKQCKIVMSFDMITKNIWWKSETMLYR